MHPDQRPRRSLGLLIAAGYESTAISLLADIRADKNLVFSFLLTVAGAAQVRYSSPASRLTALF